MHSYIPLSATVELLRNKVPSGRIENLPPVINWLFLFQKICGLGAPNVTHLISTDSPSTTFVSLSGGAGRPSASQTKLTSSSTPTFSSSGLSIQYGSDSITTWIEAKAIPNSLS
ncbi:hypothetical protein BpHYR1_012030 [Brachionus plicatilis]|uniref:Uncharacterized protein n=1 Tax=Brachionus plicatilis TaxID=10195 RepID=A0A3M7QB08_BRAPC|nr:hypothetical protein BpHYR1_012030 [Brachionus plicatilis]